MNLLVPVDGGSSSLRALRHALDLHHRFDATIDVVHFTDYKTESTEKIRDQVQEILAEEGAESDVEIVMDHRLHSLKTFDKIGEDIAEIADSNDYDYVIMGHHDAKRIERLLLGSTAETVLDSADIPLIVVS